MGETERMLRARTYGATDPFDDHVRWLGHPAFFACVAVLVANDHVLKARFPGWWTGKLSDVAGVVVVAIVLAVVVGPRRGIAAAAVAFITLKMVPGAAELAAPVLGGVTRRDTTDLIALAVLLPVWRLLEPRRPPAVRSSTAGWSRWQAGCARWRTAMSAALPVVGIVIAAAATTATSCAPSPAVIAVAADGQDLYALVGHGRRSSRWARSTDGGRSWQRGEAPSTAPTPSTSVALYEDPGPTGEQQACTSDGICWRLRDRRIIERVTDNGAEIEELQLSNDEFSDITTGCAGGSIGVLGSIAMADDNGELHVVASLGAEGVLARQDDGTWDRVRVLSAPPVEASPAESAASRALLIFGPVLGLLIWIVGRRRWPSWKRGLVSTGTGWLATIMAAGALSFAAGPDTDAAIGRVAVVGMVVTTVAAVIVARRPARPRPPVAFPRLPSPPPPSPPSARGDGQDGSRKH